MAKGAAFRAAIPVLVALALTGCGSAGGSGGFGRVPSAADLSGLDRAQLVGLLGPADFNRVDGPAEIMQYRNGTCTLDVFLYRATAAAETRVTHVEARDGNMNAVSDDACLRSVFAHSRPRTSWNRVEPRARPVFASGPSSPGYSGVLSG